MESIKNNLGQLKLNTLKEKDNFKLQLKKIKYRKENQAKQLKYFIDQYKEIRASLKFLSSKKEQKDNVKTSLKQYFTHLPSSNTKINILSTINFKQVITKEVNDSSLYPIKENNMDEAIRESPKSNNHLNQNKRKNAHNSLKIIKNNTENVSHSMSNLLLPVRSINNNEQSTISISVKTIKNSKAGEISCINEISFK